MEAATWSCGGKPHCPIGDDEGRRKIGRAISKGVRVSVAVLAEARFVCGEVETAAGISSPSVIDAVQVGWGLTGDWNRGEVGDLAKIGDDSPRAWTSWDGDGGVDP
jgi:hypothetical protein